MVKFRQKESSIIKTKVNDPFICFLIEPSIVFVYKITTQNYITVSDLFESGEWQTFALNDDDDFETFQHEGSKPLEGTGILIRQNDRNRMVEVINQHIQKHRLNGENKSDTVHIVMSESAAGSLRFGLEGPKVVIGFPDSFSIGPLWKLDEKVGQAFRSEWLAEHINDEQDDDVYENKFANTLREIADIPEQVPIYIWYGQNADEQIGLRFILYLLRDKTNELILINATENFITAQSKKQQKYHTGQIESNDLRRLYERTSENGSLSNQERIQFQKEWKTLSRSKEVLRQWINNGIEDIEENYYDRLIITSIEKLHNEQEKKGFYYDWQRDWGNISNLQWNGECFLFRVPDSTFGI